MAEIKPTLNDSDVMDFVASGYVLLEGVIDQAFNRRCNDLKRGNIDEFIASDEFTRAVLLHPQVAGVARSLLGEDFLVPAGGLDTEAKMRWEKSRPVSQLAGANGS